MNIFVNATYGSDGMFHPIDPTLPVGFSEELDNETELSECCSAPIDQFGLCMDCKEHCN